MNFVSIEFVVFLPIVFTLYWRVPQKSRWIIILLSSYFFYMSWNVRYIFLILLITVISFFAGSFLEKSVKRWIRKAILIGTIVIFIGLLCYFKYFNFFVSTLNSLGNFFSFSYSFSYWDIVLPIGISFYTFQTLSYVIDVYRGTICAETNLGIYAAYVSFFPQLVAGPIERTSNLLPQIKKEKLFDYSQALYGARLMLWGYLKKIAVADVVSVYVDKAYGDLQRCTGLDILMAIFFFSIQIYCDFSGYSDIAIGTAKLFGIDLMKNFSSPYFSCSVKEFWSRWHISLSTWFRDYLYIPLGGNRCSKLRNSLNVFITFLISGLWHGASWTFVFWGGLHGIVQIVEKIFEMNHIRKSKLVRVVSWMFVFTFCNLAWVFFRADSFGQARSVFTILFTSISDYTMFLHSNIGLTPMILIRIFVVILMVAIFDYASLKKDLLIEFDGISRIGQVVVEYIVVAVILFSLFEGVGSNQFVYFQF